MNRNMLVGISSVALLVVATVVSAAAKGESKEAKIKRAMSAGPAVISAKATIVDADGTVLREGSNGWTCMPNMSPADKTPMCNDETWQKAMHAVMEKAPFKTDKAGVSYMLQGDTPVNNDDPYDTHQDPGEHWVTEGPHIMVIVPNPEEALKNLPSDPDAGGPYVMFKGTPYAHVMIPTGPRPKKK